MPTHGQTPSQTPAPWRNPFLSHLPPPQQPTLFTLATLHPSPPSSTPTPKTSSVALPCLPRARTVVFRGFFASGSHPPSSNPPLYTSDLLTFTTDVRSDKLTEIFDTAGAGDVEASGGETGGGGPVEACFWMEPVRTQWRVRGRAWVLGADVDGEEEGAERVRGLLMGRMRRRELQGEEGDGEWRFGKEVDAHFAALSPLLRGSFRGPPPGTPVAYHTGKGETVGQRLEDVDDKVARGHFRVVVIVPEEVDQVDLSDETRPRRWLYVYRGVGGESKLPGGEVIGEWEKVEVWP